MSRISMRAEALADLNAEQRAAVEHGQEPLLVIAGAGSGKTKTLSCRVAHLVASGADPARILLLTFSRRAAAEMVRRVGVALGSDASIPWAGTFHAIGARLLRDLAPAIGLSAEFTVHDRGDSADLMGLARNEAGLGKTAKRFPMKGTCLAVYSRAVNAEETLADTLVSTFPWCREWHDELKRLFDVYVTMKQAQNVLDYDDLLLYWADAMEEPALAAEIAQRFDHVLVDEYQDTNRLQARILARLKPDGRGLTVVGDDAQAIYSFRAATVRNILDFPAAFPPTRVVTLEQNYRSTAPILAASNAVMSHAQERFTKNLRAVRTGGAKPKLVSVRDEADQAHYVAESVLEARERGVALTSQAVLFRAADFSAPLELELQRRDIPFVKFGGLKFLEAAHVKDFLAILRWAENAGDRLAGFRTLQLVPGIGPSRAVKVLDRIHAPLPLEGGGAGVGVSYKERTNSSPLPLPPPPPGEGELYFGSAPAGAEEHWDGLRKLLEALAANPEWPTDLDLVARWYQPLLEARYDDARVRAGDIVQLQRIGATFPSRQSFLTELTLDPPTSTSDESGPARKDDDYLILSTIHSAKGQEWKCVHVLNVVDGCMPSDLGAGSTAELEEERRLLYVAMTRAKDELHLITPQRFYHTQQARGGDRHVYATRSRFLPQSVLGCFEEIGWAPKPEAGASSRAPLPPIDLAAKARQRWR